MWPIRPAFDGGKDEQLSLSGSHLMVALAPPGTVFSFIAMA
jgi:hypothetical protein